MLWISFKHTHSYLVTLLLLWISLGDTHSYIATLLLLWSCFTHSFLPRKTPIAMNQFCTYPLVTCHTHIVMDSLFTQPFLHWHTPMDQVCTQRPFLVTLLFLWISFSHTHSSVSDTDEWILDKPEIMLIQPILERSKTQTQHQQNKGNLPSHLKLIWIQPAPSLFQLLMERMALDMVLRQWNWSGPHFRVGSRYAGII